MVNVVHLAAGDGSGLFWIVVAVIAVIVQIIKSRGEQAPKPHGPATGEGDPGEELRKFLESLGGGAGEAPRPASPPPPPPAPRRPPPRPHVPRTQERARPSGARTGTTIRPLPPNVAAPVPIATEVVSAPSAPPGMKESVGVGSLGMEIGDARNSRQNESERQAARQALRRRLMADLKGSDRMSLPKAILLAEILGPPIGLRQGVQAPWAAR